MLSTNETPYCPNRQSQLFFTSLDYAESCAKGLPKPVKPEPEPETVNVDVKKEIQAAHEKIQPMLIPVESSERKPYTYPTTWEEAGLEERFEPAKDLDLPAQDSLYL